MCSLRLCVQDSALPGIYQPLRRGSPFEFSYTILVHNGVMKAAEKAVRQSVTLPPKLAKQVRGMAKNRRLSKNRILLELIENGIEAQSRKQQQFIALAERFRSETDPEVANRLGDELGRMIFGG